MVGDCCLKISIAYLQSPAKADSPIVGIKKAEQEMREHWRQVHCHTRARVRKNFLLFLGFNIIISVIY